MRFDACLFSDDDFVAPKAKYPTKEDFIKVCSENGYTADPEYIEGDYCAFRCHADFIEDFGGGAYTLVKMGSRGSFPVWVLPNASMFLGDQEEFDV